METTDISKENILEEYKVYDLKDFDELMLEKIDKGGIVN